MLQCGREVPTSTAEWGLCYPVLCDVVLVNRCHFNHPVFPLLGVRHQGEGRGLFEKEKRGLKKKRVEYFVIVQTEGDTVCIYLYCIYVMKMRWLFVWHYLLPVLWFYIQCFNVDNIYFCFGFSVFDFVCHFSYLLFFVFFPLVFLFVLFGYCTVYYFCCPLRWHSYSLYWFSAIK